jgi:hypothetical protein
MAWAYVQDSSGMTPEMYDQVAAELGADAPEGLIVHVAGTHGDGMRIVDVWESEDAYTKFRDGRLRSAVEKAIGPEGMAQGPPPIDALPVRNIVRGS